MLLKKICSDFDHYEIVFLVRNGLDYQEALNMHPMERRAWFYQLAMMDGNEVNWETGRVSKRKK